MKLLPVIFLLGFCTMQQEPYRVTGVSTNVKGDTVKYDFTIQPPKLTVGRLISNVHITPTIPL